VTVLGNIDDYGRGSMRWMAVLLHIAFSHRTDHKWKYTILQETIIVACTIVVPKAVAVQYTVRSGL